MAASGGGPIHLSLITKCTSQKKMRKLTELQIKIKSVNPDHLAYLEDYWEIENNKWKYKHRDVVRRHPSIPKSPQERIKIVHEGSEVTYFDPCPKCGGETYTFTNRAAVDKCVIPARDEYPEKFQTFSFDAIPEDKSLKDLCGNCQNEEFFILSSRIRESFMQNYSKASLNFLKEVHPPFLRGLEIKKVWPYSVITFHKYTPWYAGELEEEIKQPPIIQELLNLDIVSLLKGGGNEQWGPVYTTIEIGNFIQEVINPILYPPSPVKITDPFSSDSIITFGSKLNASFHGREKLPFHLEEIKSSPEEPFQAEEEADLTNVKPVVGSSGNRRQFFKELLDEFVNVFPGVAYSRFINGKALEDTLTYKEYKYFLTASCFALITDENFIPKRIIEYNAKRSNPENYAIKVKIAQFIGLHIEDKVRQ
ncbi:hypothetical protein [Nafulsella turpanensis]|uniref:hypothetical protein n=1 Tax=Nafulsella turpanensis TaxID=1265690 RepID=UPI000349AE0B|nr:hypothetical protein [Nafulsella turpanensis]